MYDHRTTISTTPESWNKIYIKKNKGDSGNKNKPTTAAEIKKTNNGGGGGNVLKTAAAEM